MAYLEISNGQDIMDSRDVIERLDELQGARDDLDQAVEDLREELDLAQEELDLAEEEDLHDRADEMRAEVERLNNEIGTAEAALRAWDEENESEFEPLKDFAKQGEDYASDWNHGATLIRDSHFEDYAQELAEDIGAIDRNAAWPACHIDWAAAAESLKQDYTSIEFDGVTYWVR